MSRWIIGSKILFRPADNAATQMDATKIWIHQVRNFGRSIIPDQPITLIFIMIQIIKNVNATCTAISDKTRQVLPFETNIILFYKTLLCNISRPRQTITVQFWLTVGQWPSYSFNRFKVYETEFRSSVCNNLLLIAVTFMNNDPWTDRTVNGFRSD